MDCNLARTLLVLGRTEMQEADAQSLDLHLANCPACQQGYRAQYAFDQAMAKAIKNVIVPTDLHRKLLTQVYAHQGALLRHKLYRWGSLAALVMVCSGLAVGGYWKTRPQINTDQLAFQVEIEREEAQATVENWLLAQDLPRELPVDFEYHLHSFHGFAEIEDRLVPMLQFQQGADFARVYFIRDSKFNFENLQDAQRSLVRIKTYSNPDQRGLRYLILYTTEDLSPFLKIQIPAV